MWARCSRLSGMGRQDQTNELAETQGFLIDREQAISLGWSSSGIGRQVDKGAWLARHPGVYQVDQRHQEWIEKVIAAVLAGGADCLASHRAALVLWGMDGIGSAPVEITAPYSKRPIPEGVVVHRTRRPMTGNVVHDVPTTTPERTLLDCAWLLPPMIVSKALESALRKRLTTVDLIYDLLAKKGGRGVRGVKKLKRVLAQRVADTPTGSGSETEALVHIRRAMLPEPVLQQEFFSADGERMLPDFYWPQFNKAVEVDGLDAHDSADKLDHDLRRQNALLDLGIELRRFSARRVRRDPAGFVAEVRRFLGFSNLL